MKSATAAYLLAFLTATGASGGESARLRLADDFEGKDFASSGGLYYKRNREQEAGTVAFRSGDARKGAQALELSVDRRCPQPGAALCSERAEVWERPDVLAPYGAPVWYAFSMRLVPPIPTERRRLVMAQWKRQIEPGATGDFSPFLALRLISGRIAATIDTNEGRVTPAPPEGCPPGETPASRPDRFGQSRALAMIEPGADSPRAAGFDHCAAGLRVTPRGGATPPAGSGWIDFVIFVQPDAGGRGKVELAANGARIATIEGRIGHRGPGLGPKQYFKFGPYRAGATESWRILYDSFRRGPDCGDVAPDSLCALMR